MRLRLLSGIIAVSVILSVFSGCYRKVKVNKADLSSDVPGQRESGLSSEMNFDSSVTSVIQSQMDQGSDSIVDTTSNTAANSSNTNGITSAPPIIDISASKYARFTDFNRCGMKLIGLLSQYWYSDSQGFKMKDNPFSKDKPNDPVTLWGYGSYLESLGAYLSANPNNAFAKSEYVKTLNGLEMYVDKEKTSTAELAYHCWADPNSNAEIFFDDNVWILHELMNAYKLLGDDKYLALAKRNIEYILNRGWDKNYFGGGLLWEDKSRECNNPDHQPTAGTCINAPMAFALTEMYELTNHSYYKDWAVKIYSWTMQNLYDKNDHLFFDQIKRLPEGNKRIDTKYTYNVGNMISAAAGLYKITKDAKYLTDANLFAQAAFVKFLIPVNDIGDGNPAYVWNSIPMPWFNSNLVKGFIQLYKVSPNETVKNYITCCKTSLGLACLSTNDTTGFIPPNWFSSSTVQPKDKQLLSQAATARTLFMLHEWNETSKK